MLYIYFFDIKYNCFFSKKIYWIVTTPIQRSSIFSNECCSTCCHNVVVIKIKYFIGIVYHDCNHDSLNCVTNLQFGRGCQAKYTTDDIRWAGGPWLPPHPPLPHTHTHTLFCVTEKKRETKEKRNNFKAETIKRPRPDESVSEFLNEKCFV